VNRRLDDPGASDQSGESGPVTALQGSIGAFALTEILLLLARSGASGELRVTREGDQHTIWFDQGLVRGAGEEVPDEEQMRTRVLDVLRWDAGDFSFNPGNPPDAEFSVSVEGLLLEASAKAEATPPPSARTRGPRRPPRLDRALTKDLLIKLMSGIEKL
jgi:hypothetical protein